MDKFNSEGYFDPTAYNGLRSLCKLEDDEIKHECNKLIKLLKSEVHNAGFELVSRIQLKHTKFGDIFI